MYNLKITCNRFSLRDGSGPLLGKDTLFFNSHERPPPVSDYLIFAFWVVAYGRLTVYKKFSKVRLKKTEF